MSDHAKGIRNIREMSIVIDSWDDIFSDFDPRPLHQRTLSEDFVSELRKRYMETRKGDFLISIYAPVVLDDPKSEKGVIQRLRKDFKQRSLKRRKELGVIRMRGILFLAFGITSLSFLTLATYFKYYGDLAIELLGIIFMPLGWFGIWEGFSKVVDTSPVITRDVTLFDKLSKAEYHFSYGDENK